MHVYHHWVCDKKFDISIKSYTQINNRNLWTNNYYLRNDYYTTPKCTTNRIHFRLVFMVKTIYKWLRLLPPLWKIKPAKTTFHCIHSQNKPPNNYHPNCVVYIHSSTCTHCTIFTTLKMQNPRKCTLWDFNNVHKWIYVDRLHAYHYEKLERVISLLYWALCMCIKQCFCWWP